MNALQRIRLRQSECRERLLRLGQQATLTEAEDAELDSLAEELAGLERRARALMLAGESDDEPATDVTPDADATDAPDDDAEVRERLDLRSRVTLTGFVAAALRGGRVDGAEAEYSAAHGARGDIPFALFEDEDAERRAVTNAPGTVGVNMAPIQPAVFAPSLAASLGVDMPRVQSGTFGQSRISTSLTAGAEAKGAEGAATAATFATATTTPHRVTAMLEFLAEDVLSAGVNNFESSLRENLSMALAAELDDLLINGNGVAPNPTGLLKALGADPSVAGEVIGFATGLEYTAAFVDGLFAPSLGQVRQVVGVDTYRKLAALVTSAATGEVTLAEYLNRVTGGIRAHHRMPAKGTGLSGGNAAKGQVALIHRTGHSNLRTAVCPQWGRIGITDVYTGAAKAETRVVFHVMIGDVLVIQPGAYAKTSYRLDA